MSQLESPERDELFPQGYIFAEREAFQLLPSSLKHVYEGSHVIWTSQRTNAQADSYVVSSVSTLKFYPCKAGLRMDLEVHGTSKQNLSSHLRTGLMFLKENYADIQGNLLLVLTYDLRLKLTDESIFSSYIGWMKSPFYGDAKTRIFGQFFHPKLNSKL